MAKLSPDRQLERITGWLVQLWGARLQSLLVYGSVVGNHHPTRHSDIHLLAVLDTIDGALLGQAAEAVRWWTDQGNPAPVLLSRDEQDASGDVFPIEYLDIQAHHRLLHGADFFTAAPRFPQLHRLQVEHDLRAKLVRLRAGYLRIGSDRGALETMLLDSISTFLTLLRHALVAVGEPLRLPKDEVLAAAASRFGFEPAAFTAVLAARRGGPRLAAGKLQPMQGLFAQYLDAIQRVERSLEEYHESAS